MQDFAAFAAALKSLGFLDAQETASGAYLVKTEYERLVAEHWNHTIIPRRPTIVQLIEKHYPKALPYLAPVLSPMQAHGQALRKQYPGAILVFIGPCIAKRMNASVIPAIWIMCSPFLNPAPLALQCICLLCLYRGKTEPSKRLSRFFPVSGGILKTMAPDAEYQYVCVDEVESCIQALERNLIRRPCALLC